MSQGKIALKESRLSESFHRYGWIVLFWVVCFSVYSHAMNKKSEVCLELRKKILDFEEIKASVKSEQEHLALQIQSQNDLDWIEMVLKQKLGVVSEGQMKVYFKRDE